MWRYVLAVVTGWKQYYGHAEGIKINGDPTVPMTTWFNLIWLKYFRWNKVSILRIPADKAQMGYRIGYRPFKGPAKIKIQALFDDLVAILNGHEDCTFFAEDMNGEEIELVLESQVMKSDPALEYVQLI